MASRGDIKAVSDGVVAYVSGGFTDTNGYCPSLDTVEKYTFATDTWEALPPLQTGRGDKALVLLNGHLFAMGGENQVQGSCNITNAQPGEQTIVVDDVELFDNGAWKVLTSLRDRRFRFDAVADQDHNSIFTFGGQLALNSSCQCFRTSDEIHLYIHEFNDEKKSSAPLLSSLGSLLLVIFGAFLLV